MLDALDPAALVDVAVVGEVFGVVGQGPRLEGEPVLLGEPTRSDFDLRFHLFGVPVRVHPTFWLFSAILGWNWVDLAWEYLLLWIGCSFVSILLHEMGHVFMAMMFGR